MKKVLISCMTHDAQNYQSILEELNVTPVLSCNIENEQDYDGLLLPGGGDISPIFYHQRNKRSRNICVSEDIIQLLLFHRFYDRQKPILGICKGMQLINVALGGTLRQSIPSEQMHICQNGDCFHKTILIPGSILFSLYSKEIIVNSAHHQAVDALGRHLIATQYSYDGVIEGIEHNHLPILGVQWHPERLKHPCAQNNTGTACSSGIPVLEWFVKKL